MTDPVGVAVCRPHPNPVVPRRHRFGGRWWSIKQVLCSKGGPATAWVQEGFRRMGFKNWPRSPARQLEFLLHEGLHASLPHIREDTVREAARELGWWLRRCGYERVDKSKKS
jgi:hypothetical protein